MFPCRWSSRETKVTYTRLVRTQHTHTHTHTHIHYWGNKVVLKTKWVGKVIHQYNRMLKCNIMFILSCSFAKICSFLLLNLCCFVFLITKHKINNLTQKSASVNVHVNSLEGIRVSHLSRPYALYTQTRHFWHNPTRERLGTSNLVNLKAKSLGCTSRPTR
jgi:hypothetical protein